MPVVLVTTLTSEDIATRLADGLMEGLHHLPVQAAGAFEAEPPLWRFEAWFKEAPDLGDFALTGQRLLGPEFATLHFDHKLVDDTDWVAKSLEDLPPVRAGRFVVHGAHDRHKLRPNDLGLEIEASLAFGTGHHPTTLGCLLAIDQWLKQRTARKAIHAKGHRPTMLDIGSGTGVLALAFTKGAKAQAIAGDLDVEAVRIASENVAKAGLNGDIAVVLAAGTHHPLIRWNAPYPLVVANILAGPLMRLAPAFARVTQPGGTLILSGLLAWQARSIAARYQSQGYALARRRILGDWATLELVKR